MPEKRATAYTDGACIGNPGPGGWGVHVEFLDGRILELGGGELRTTNNQMELRAAIEAVRLTASCTAVTVITDSQYVRRGITEWVPKWKQKNWQTTARQSVKNQQLWIELDALSDSRVAWEWTRGHVGTPGNERCDAIANWFASSIRSLERSGATSDPQLADTEPRRLSTTHYLSLVDGVVARHATWQDCERRVHAVRGARFRKVRSPDDERAVVASWGLPPDALAWT